MKERIRFYDELGRRMWAEVTSTTAEFHTLIRQGKRGKVPAERLKAMAGGVPLVVGMYELFPDDTARYIGPTMEQPVPTGSLVVTEPGPDTMVAAGTVTTVGSLAATATGKSGTGKDRFAAVGHTP